MNNVALKNLILNFIAVLSSIDLIFSECSKRVDLYFLTLFLTLGIV